MTPPRLFLPSLVLASILTSMVSSMGILLVPLISITLQVPTNLAQWTLTVNLLVGAAMTPTLGRLSDGPRKRGLLLVTIVIVLAGCLIAALAPNLPLLLLGRALQGFAFGITAIAISLAREHLGPEHSGPAISTLSVSVATGLGAGYPLTGLVVQYLDFRFAFWLAAVLVICSLVACSVAIPKTFSKVPAKRFDRTGATLFAVGMGALVIGVAQGPVAGWASPPILSSLAIAAAALVAWGIASQRSRSPIFNLRLLRLPDVTFSHISSLILGTIVYLLMSCTVILILPPPGVNYGTPLDATWAGLSIAPVAIGSGVIGWAMTKWHNQRILFWLMPAGSITLAVAAVLLILAPTSILSIVGSSVLVGFGMGAIAGAGPVLIAQQVPVLELGSTVSFSQVLRMAGGSVGSAIAGAFFAAATVSTGGAPTKSSVMAALTAAGTTAALLTLTLVAYGIRRGRRADEQ